MSGKERKRSTDLSNFIDEHLQELKWTSCGLGAFAVLILIRKLNMTKKFVEINQIPSQYVAENYTLQGHVRHINDRGVLKIDHIPILEMKWIPSIFSLLRQDASRINGEFQYLSVLPAGLDMNPDAVLWLQDHALGKHAWFQIFARDEEDLHCDIRIKKGYFGGVSISHALIEEGLCKVQDLQSLPDSKHFHRYLGKIIALENTASNKGKGIWKEQDSWLKRKGRHVYAWGTEKLNSFFKKDKY